MGVPPPLRRSHKILQIRTLLHTLHLQDPDLDIPTRPCHFNLHFHSRNFTPRSPQWLPYRLYLYVPPFLPSSPISVYYLSVSSGSLANARAVELGYLAILSPPEKVLRFVESKLNLLGRVPHYVSVDQKTYGRYGVLPTSVNENRTAGGGSNNGAGEIELGGVGGGAVEGRQWTGGSGRLGP